LELHSFGCPLPVSRTNGFIIITTIIAAAAVIVVDMSEK
jgi:hypothetical protein